MENSPFYYEIKSSLYDMGHRENFLLSTTDAIDTLFLNYLARYTEIQNGKVNNLTIEQWAALNIQNFYKNYIMDQINSGASEKWGKNVLFATYTCLSKLSRNNTSIKILLSTFESLLLN